MSRFPRKISLTIYRRDKYRCKYCLIKLTPENWSIDHKRSKGNGGTDDEDNLVASCKECNGRKAQKEFTKIYKCGQKPSKTST